MVYPILFASVHNGKPVRNLDELLMMPEDFGVSRENRLDCSVDTREKAVIASEQEHIFCRSKGLEERTSYLYALFLEEITCNIIEHGFIMDAGKNSVDIRVVYKPDEVILRVRDNCVPFNPEEQMKMSSPEDAIDDLGILTVYSMAREITYQNILGLNVLTVKV